MVSRLVGAAFGALILGANAISTRPQYWNTTCTSIVAVCGDDCWSTSTVYPAPVTVTELSTTTVWSKTVSTIMEVQTEPASTVTVTVTEKPPPPPGEPSEYSHIPAPSSQPASVVTVYITTSVVVVSVQPTTETDVEV